MSFLDEISSLLGNLLKSGSPSDYERATNPSSSGKLEGADQPAPRSPTPSERANNPSSSGKVDGAGTRSATDKERANNPQTSGKLQDDQIVNMLAQAMSRSPTAAERANNPSSSGQLMTEALGSLMNPIQPFTPAALASTESSPTTDATLSSVQNRVDGLMQNDPAFRAAMGYEPLPPDPLIADAYGWNLPKTGQVNTTGATQRINARTGMHGVTAAKDANGQITMTNIQGGGDMAYRPEASSTAITPNVSVELAKASSAIGSAKTVEDAQALLGNLRMTAATEVATIRGEATKLASAKSGVPALEKKLLESEMADKQDPQWYAGIGDSPITKGARQELFQARQAADQEAERFMASNTRIAGMSATMKSAEDNLQRVIRNSDRQNQLVDNISMRSADRDMAKKEAADQRTADILSVVTPEARRRMMTLNPQYAMTGNHDRDIAMIAKAASTNKERMEAIQAPWHELPILALGGNPDAELLVIAEEAKSTGASTDAVKTKLADLRAFAQSPDFAKNVIKADFGNKSESDEAKKALVALSAPMTGMSAADKELNRRIRFEKALEIERKSATTKARDDTMGWKTVDLAFEEARKRSLAVSGNASLPNVVAAYLGTSSGPEALAKGAALVTIMEGALRTGKTSMFGAPDTMALKAEIEKQAGNVSRGKALLTGVGDALSEISRNVKVMEGQGWNHQLYKYLTEPADPTQANK